jgi:gamma-glutamyltranspeptidase/glutathione hydrolase
MRRERHLSRTAAACATGAAILCGALSLAAQERPERLVRPTPAAVISGGGMVAAEHPLAAQVGLRILREGGNAVDAVAATVIAVGLLQSNGSDGITGEGFGLFYNAKTGEIRALDWGSRIPDSPEFSKKVDEIKKQDDGINLIAPGALAGLDTAVQTLGTMKLAQILAPSIEYCENGIPVREQLARAIKGRADVFRKDPRAAAIFLPGGQPPPVGYLLKMPNIARSLRLIAAQGREVMYKGELAKEILKFSAEAGGLISQKDLDVANNPSWVKPLSTTYHGNTIYAVPPGAGGIPLLQAMNILEGFNFKTMSEAERTHVFAEVFKISLNEMETYFGDPERTREQLERLLSKKNAAELMSTIKMNGVLDWKMAPGERVEEGTSHTVVVDAQGNVASVTNTRSSWGIARPAGDTGLFLHGGTRLLSTNPNHPMYAKPGKRLQKSITPYLVFDSQNRLIFAGGAAGGRTITHANAQVLVNFLDLGMDPQRAISAPRVAYDGAGRKLEMSYGFDPKIVESLKALGHQIVIGESSGAQAIAIDPVSHARSGGADPRVHGGVVGY